MKKLLTEWRKFLKEIELLNELLVRGHDDGDEIISYKQNLWKLRHNIYPDDPVNKEISQALNIEDEWEDIWELRELLDDASRTDVLAATYNEEAKQLELHRIGTFRLDPKSSVVVKKVAQALGAQSVVYAPDDLGQTYTSIRSVKGEVADIMYHGTTTDYLSSLLRLGLVPGKKETNYEGISHPSAVFFSSRFDEAKHHAVHTARKVGGDPVVAALKVPDKALLIPDYDVDVGAGDTGCYDYICQVIRDKAKGKLDIDSFSLSREVGVYGYKGRVPSSAIFEYYILMNSDEMGDKAYYADEEDYTAATPQEAATYIETKDEFGYGSLEYPEWDEEDEE